MTKTPLNLIVDSKEQKPLKFEQFEVNINKDHLEAGDYTLVGHDRPEDDFSVIIERKADCQELVKNLAKEWPRFVREAEILAKYKIRQIVVCGPDNFAYLHSRGFTKLHPNFVYKQLAILHLDYGISTIFLENREAAENYIFRLFHQITRRLRDYDNQ